MSFWFSSRIFLNRPAPARLITISAMTDRGISRLLDYLRRQAPPGPDLAPDGMLLGKYADARDEPAFELLVRRHGALVWSAVHRILRDEHAAEDALQATFLALARKANSLRGSTSVAGWLYRVAVRIALRARPKSQPTLPMPEADGDPAIAVERNELITIVDEEVNRLPERLRQAVVLCCFGGHSAEEAATRLGCPRGTILSRLHTGRERLRQQLTRRGFESVAIGPLLAECAPSPLTSSLIAIAIRAAGPAAALSPVAVTLAHGVITAMFMTKMKIAAVALVAAAGLGIGATHWAGAAQDAKEKAPVAKAQDAKPQATDGDARLREVEDRVLSLMRLAEEEKRRQEMARRGDADRLAAAEKHLWEIINREQAEREKLQLDQVKIIHLDDEKLKLEAVENAIKAHYLRLYQKEPGRDFLVKNNIEKPEVIDQEIELIRICLNKLSKERDMCQSRAIEIAAARIKIENLIKRSELREQLELEKYRKLLK